MNMKHITIALAAACGIATTFAQTAGTEVQRNINQQQRIEQGLQSGALNTREAARLEREQAGINKLQSNALKDGQLTDAEKARIDKAQDRVSQDIYQEKHDAQRGNPNSKSSQRMQADVQRNINQQKRIKAGIDNGSLTNREVGKLERGQARTERKEYRAGRDGRVGPAEQARIQQSENRHSARIYKEKHDAQVRQ